MKNVPTPTCMSHDNFQDHPSVSSTIFIVTFLNTFKSMKAEMHNYIEYSYPNIHYLIPLKPHFHSRDLHAQTITLARLKDLICLR